MDTNTKTYRDSIMTKLTLKIAEQAKSGMITDEQLSPVCKDVLTAVENPTTPEALFVSVSELSEKWPMFVPIVDEMKKKSKAFSDLDTLFDRTNQSGSVH